MNVVQIELIVINSRRCSRSAHPGKDAIRAARKKNCENFSSNAPALNKAPARTGSDHLCQAGLIDVKITQKGFEPG